MRFPAIVVCSFLLSFSANAQIDMPVFGTHPVLSGYANAIAGEVWPYFSVYPDHAKEALLTRCTDGQMSIEWETAPAPAAIKEPYVYFSWIAAHSTGTSKGIRNFDLSIDGKSALTFTTHPQQYPAVWTYAGPDSTRLVFEFKKQDGAADAHGIAYLRVPASRCTPGQPLRLKVAGQAQQSSDWYMTFKYSFEEKIDIVPLPFLLRAGKVAKQPLQVTVLHFGAPEMLKISLNKGKEQRFTVLNGIQTFELEVPAVKQNTPMQADARIGEKLQVTKTVELRRVVPREIGLVHHSHTDIGYSHYQEDVARIHTANLRNALRTIDKTRNYPEGSRFVWNVESLWAVENFLREAGPEETTRFVEAVKNRSIGLSGLYANVLTGLCSRDELRWWTEYADTLRHRYKLEIRSAMFSDIPGLSWDAVPALAQKGIRYFSNGPNYIEPMPDKGDRIGSTIREQGDKPFWWKSADGQDSILFWTCGKGYSSWHGYAAGGIADRGPKKIAAYLNELDDKAYPYTMVQWRYNIGSDNGPIDSTLSDFVKAWNEKYTSPRLVISNVTDFFERFEKTYGKTIPTFSGDFTPYWEDGAYSSAAEETENRMLSSRLSHLEKVAQLEQKKVPANWWHQAKRHILLFHEHTWGAWNSVSAPDDPFALRQWEYKKRLLDSARVEVNRLENTLLPKSTGYSQVEVLNTLPWMRSGFVAVDWPLGSTTNALTSPDGQIIPVQLLSDGRRGFIARAVPAQSCAVYLPCEIPEDPATMRFTPKYLYQVNPSTGAFNSIKSGSTEWIDASLYKGLLQALYVAGRNPDSFQLSAIQRLEWLERGPVVQKLRIHTRLEGTNSVAYDIAQYNGLDALALSVIVDKTATRNKESMHFAFPFRLFDPVVRIGVGDTWISPGENQIPGSNKDYYAVQRCIDVSDKSMGVTLSSPQGALYEIGNMVDERQLDRGFKIWKNEGKSASTLFLYALNNYWHTNYKADQSGIIKYDIYLQFHEAFDAGKARAFGAETAEPLIGIWK